MAGQDGSFIPLIVASITELSPDFKMLSFADGHGINHQPGQYLTLVDKIGNHEIRRSYSILSVPFLNEPLAIGVKRIDNGHFSRKLVDRTHIGDTILSTGAGGFFRLPENIKELECIVLFAAGSGITPVYSVLRAALYRHTHLQVILFYSNHSRATTALYEQLKGLEGLFGKRLTIHFRFSTEKQLRQARLTRDHLIDFIQSHKKQFGKTFFYTCGPESYMMKVMFVLIESGVPKEHIRKEEFVNHKIPVSKSLPPEKYSGQVHIHFNNKEYKFKLHYPETILQAAKKHQLSLPYSCETGKCGSCAATCINGHIWMSNNEVLTEDDLEKKLILTCVAHPMSEVVLKIGE